LRRDTKDTVGVWNTIGLMPTANRLYRFGTSACTRLRPIWNKNTKRKPKKKSKKK